MSTNVAIFLQFMENERATEILQCFLDLDNFQHLLATQVDGHNNVTPMQGDAVILYDKYVFIVNIIRLFGWSTFDQIISHLFSACAC